MNGEYENRRESKISRSLYSKKDSSERQTSGAEDTESRVLGYFINYGITSCRIFEIYKDGKTLHQLRIISYNVSEPDDLEEYLWNIIAQTKNDIIPILGTDRTGLFVKTFADANFGDLFDEADDDIFDDFIMDFYQETSLSFNILTYAQTENNIRSSFGAIENNGAIINIGSTYVDIFLRRDGKFKMLNLPVSLSAISAYVQEKQYGEKWDAGTINQIKNYVSTLISDELDDVSCNKAYILKDELTFMQENAYPLTREGERFVITTRRYKRANRSNLFGVDYRAKLNKMYPSDENAAKRLYGFKIGHIVLETLFDKMRVQFIYPSDLHSIHGNADAYIYNIVVGGSIADQHGENMIQACQLLRETGATVISPMLTDNFRELKPKTDLSHREHIKALRQCDLLFISNKDSYFGEQTCCQIYGAHALYKTIAFWKEPSLEVLQQHDLQFIPHECWDNKMKVLEEQMNMLEKQKVSKE